MSDILRRFCDRPLSKGNVIQLSDKSHHYLYHVRRLNDGDNLSLFNAQDGEWRATVTNAGRNKMMVEITNQLHPAPADIGPKRHLYFAPVKKNQQDMIIEKSTELGVTDLHPMITQYTQTRRVNTDRYWDQARNATEQSGRLAIPTIHDPVNFSDLIKTDVFSSNIGVFAALARHDNGDDDIRSLTDALSDSDHVDHALIIGPEGGFSDHEKQQLIRHPSIQAVHLGPTILRSETAVIAGLSIIHLN